MPCADMVGRHARLQGPLAAAACHAWAVFAGEVCVAAHSRHAAVLHVPLLLPWLYFG